MPETAAQKTQAFENSIDTKKDPGLQLPENFEQTFKGKEKLANRRLLLGAVESKFAGMEPETKDFLKQSCQNEIDSWTKGKSEAEIKGLKDELNPDPKNSLKNSGKIAVIYLYDALNNIGKKNEKNEEINYKGINYADNSVDIAMQNAKKNIENDRSMNMAITKPVVPIEKNITENITKQVTTEMNNITNPELKKMGEITEPNKWMNIPNGLKGWEYAKVDGKMVARSKSNESGKKYDYSVYSKENNKRDNPTADQGIQIAGITNLEFRKMGEIKTEKQWTKIPSGQEGWEYTKIDGKMIAKKQNTDNNYRYREFDAKKNKWNTITPDSQTLAAIKPIIDNTKPVVATTEVKPVVTEAKPVVAEVKPVVTEAKPVVNEAKPVVNEVKPVVNEVKPVVNEVKENTEKENISGVFDPSNENEYANILGKKGGIFSGKNKGVLNGYHFEGNGTAEVYFLEGREAGKKYLYTETQALDASMGNDFNSIELQKLAQDDNKIIDISPVSFTKQLDNGQVSVITFTEVKDKVTPTPENITSKKNEVTKPVIAGTEVKPVVATTEVKPVIATTEVKENIEQKVFESTGEGVSQSEMVAKNKAMMNARINLLQANGLQSGNINNTSIIDQKAYKLPDGNYKYSIKIKGDVSA